MAVRIERSKRFSDVVSFTPLNPFSINLNFREETIIL